MNARFGQGVLELVQGNIVDQRVDAIVNAANTWLAGGGGVDGAIHDRGGPTIMEETGRRYPEGCPVGHAVFTGAGNLNAKYVIHAVGPVYCAGNSNVADQLASAYRSSLRVAAELECESVALPALSTGAYSYPLPLAARIALNAAAAHLNGNALPRVVRFVLFDRVAVAEFEKALVEIVQASPRD